MSVKGVSDVELGELPAAELGELPGELPGADLGDLPGAQPGGQAGMWPGAAHLSWPTVRPTNWLFACLYCGGGDDTDALLPAVASWLEEVRAQWPIDSAHFLRFLDLRGHHLRVRVQAHPDELDEIAQHLEPLAAAARAAPVRTVERLVPDPLTPAGQGRPGLRLAVYGPEYSKYGGLAGVESAERHFDASSRWCLTHRIWEIDQPVARVALAARLLAQAAGQLPLAPAEFLAEHLRTWGPRLPAQLRGGAALEPVVEQVLDYEGWGLVPWGVCVESLGELAQDAAIAITRMEVGPKGRRAIDLLHMDLNRLGLNAAEECVAGVCARYLLKG